MSSTLLDAKALLMNLAWLGFVTSGGGMSLYKPAPGSQQPFTTTDKGSLALEAVDQLRDPGIGDFGVGDGQERLFQLANLRPALGAMA